MESLRPKELNYLTKFLPQIKNGQPKTVLLKGDNGTGKTYLLKEFIDTTKKSNCQTLYLDFLNYNGLEDFYRAILTYFEAECIEIINNTLLKINSIYDEKLNWTENDLKSALDIVKLQSSTTPKITPAQIAKSIKGSMKLFSRIKPEFDGSIDILSDFLTDPWIILASNYNNPADEVFKSSIELGKFSEEEIESSTPIAQIYKQQLLKLLLHINNHIKQKDTALILVLDHFENISNFNHNTREHIKNLLNTLFEELNQGLDLHIMFLVSCSTQQQSLTLGGNLYTNFSNRLLVAPLASDQSISLINYILESKKINVTGDINTYISSYCEGNPFWIYRCLSYTDLAAKSINLKTIDEGFLKQFLPKKVTELLNLNFSLLTSTFASDINSVDNMLKAMVLNKEPFSIYNLSKLSGINETSCKLIFSEFVKYELLNLSTGEGFTFSHPIIKEFITSQYKNNEYFNTYLLNLLKLLSIIHQEIYSKTNPSASVRYLKDLCEQSKQTKIITQLFKLLEIAATHNDPDIKIAAIEGLKELSSPEAINTIIKLVNDSSIEVRKKSLEALESLIIVLDSTEEVLNNIITALKASMYDKDISIRLNAIAVLGKIQTRSSFDALIALLKDKDENIRALALKNLGKVYNEEYYYIFLERMTDVSSKVRVCASEQLSKYKTRQSIQVLCAGLEDTDKSVRKACAKALGMLQYPEVAISLINALNDPDEDIKLAIIKSLGKLQNKRAVPHLKEILESPNSDVIYWATTRALGNIACKESIEILDNMATTKNSIVQHAALCSLDKIKSSLN